MIVDESDVGRDVFLFFAVAVLTRLNGILLCRFGPGIRAQIRVLLQSIYLGMDNDDYFVALTQYGRSHFVILSPLGIEAYRSFSNPNWR